MVIKLIRTVGQYDNELRTETQTEYVCSFLYPPSFTQFRSGCALFNSFMEHNYFAANFPEIVGSMSSQFHEVIEVIRC